MSPSCLTGAVQGRVQIVALSIVSGREINPSLGDCTVAKVSSQIFSVHSNRTYVSDMAFSFRQRTIPTRDASHHVPVLKIVSSRSKLQQCSLKSIYCIALRPGWLSSQRRNTQRASVYSHSE